MPEISRFFGISILMYFNDHSPPHFHAKYNEHRAVFRITDMMMVEGKLPPRVAALVFEWASLHRSELAGCWAALAETGTLKRIAPLV
ncbi:MAG: DUF4160 domain-containing protein [Proteobacteria bacterium]|jgi:hypothetical protein|nr:DUF4160 domain-containing protein [Pseudomonadota bacterium]